MMRLAETFSACSPYNRDGLLVRPAHKRDVYSMIGVLQTYAFIAENFKAVTDFLTMEANKTMVTVARGGDIVSFGIHDRHIDGPDHAVVMLYHRQIDPAPQHVFRLVRAFALLAMTGRDKNPQLSLMTDPDDALASDIMKQLDAKSGSPRSVIQAYGGRKTMILQEIDGLADKFARPIKPCCCVCA